MKRKVVAVIPARMGASRFPGKPLALIAGLPMVEHVRRRALLAKSLDGVVVATCDAEIMDAVRAFGGQAVMTDARHERCTERVHEASLGLDADIVLQVQGDEPLFDPCVLDRLAECMLADETLVCANLISTIEEEYDLRHEDIVKAALSEQGDVLFFSRSPIPHLRVRKGCPLYRQTGLAAFTKDFLATFVSLPPTALEVAESVDFLRILGHGHRIRAVIHKGVTLGVDRPEDVEKIEAALAADPQQRDFFKRVASL